MVGITYGYFLQIEGIIHLKSQHIAHFLMFTRLHIQRIEFRLSLSQSNLHLTRLQHLIGMVRTDTQTKSAIHDIFAQSESQFHNALVGLFVTHGIVVDATSHTRNRRIKTTLIFLPDHLLQDDRHFLLVNHIRRGNHIVLTGTIEHAGIDTLDGIRQHFETYILIVGTRYHVGGIDAGKWLIVAIFQQRRGTDGNGTIHHIHEGHEVICQFFGQSAMQEVLQDFFIWNVRKRHLIKRIRFHETVKDICTKHHRLRNLHRGIFKRIQVFTTLDDIVKKRQASTLSAQRTLADAGKLAITIKTVAMENSHHAPILHLTVTDNGIEDVLAVGIHIRLHLPRNLLQELRHRENSTGSQPARNVVVTQMITERPRRNREDIVLQFLQVVNTSHLFHRVRIAEDEIAKTEMPGKQVLGVLIDFLGILVNKSRLALVSVWLLVALAGIEHQRHIFIHFTDGAEQFEARQFILLITVGKHRETAVADDS